MLDNSHYAHSPHPPSDTPNHRTRIDTYKERLDMNRVIIFWLNVGTCCVTRTHDKHAIHHGTCKINRASDPQTRDDSPSNQSSHQTCQRPNIPTHYYVPTSPSPATPYAPTPQPLTTPRRALRCQRCAGATPRCWVAELHTKGRLCSQQMQLQLQRPVQ